MQRATLFLLLALAPLVACGPAYLSEGNQFEIRTERPHADLAASAGVILQVKNSLPAVETPAPHEDIVSHIDAKVCSAPTQQARRRRAQDANGR